MLASITPVILFSAFVLLLLVSLSVPIIKSIDLLRLTAAVSDSFSGVSADVTGSVKFGVWGYCISQINAEVAGQSFSQDGQCSPRHLGFTIDSTVAQFLGIDENVRDDVSRAITAVLVLHPIACGITFLAFLFSLFMLVSRGPHLRSRLCSGFTLGMSILAAVVTTVVFLIDVIFVAVVRKKLDDDTDGDVHASWGVGTWLALAAAVLTWLGCVGACCGIFACGGRRRKFVDHERY